MVWPDNVFYIQVQPEDAQEIVQKHLVEGTTVDRLLYEEPGLKEKVREQTSMRFYQSQKRIALRNCGLINPENIEEYIANQGYEALARALHDMTPTDVTDTMSASGLRGRGGGGFPVGRKWQIAAAVESDEKYIICNADEGDPGAFMDRAIMEYRQF